mgnify:CR=1 FL=1
MMKQSPTELLKTDNNTIDKLTTSDALSLMLNDQKFAIEAVKQQLENFNEIIEMLFRHFNSKSHGRLVYCGSGTSARIGVQDGVELYPTFGWAKNKVDFVIAGGNKSLTSSIENSEDDKIAAKNMIKKLKVNSKDVVIGLAASGNTPFTFEALKLAKEQKAKIIVISNNPNGSILKLSKYKIVLNTKEEVVAGSTRLKAATAQKISLNLISTILMTKLGFVKNGYMINLIANNEKLRNRKKLIMKKLKESS